MIIDQTTPERAAELTKVLHNMLEIVQKAIDDEELQATPMEMLAIISQAVGVVLSIQGGKFPPSLLMMMVEKNIQVGNAMAAEVAEKMGAIQ